MAVLTVFTMYVVLTAAALLTARVLIYVFLRQVEMPDKPEKKPLSDCAAESLRKATELRLDATSYYNHLSGKV